MIRGAICALLAALIVGLPARAAAETLAVGPEQALKQPSEAARVARDGDTVSIDPGTYFDCAVWSAGHLTIIGTGEVMITDKTCQGKGLFIVRGDDMTIRHVTFARARVPDGNGAGIRLEAPNLTVEDCRFLDDQSGILAGDAESSTISISDSEFAGDGGCEPGCAHALSIGRIAMLRVTRSHFTGTRLAHHISSQARRTELAGDTIEDGADGTSSYLVDLPSGGDVVLDHDVLEKGKHSSNPRTAIMIGDGGPAWPGSTVTATGNRITNDTGQPIAFIVNWSDAVPKMDGNELPGDVTPVSTSGAWLHGARTAAGGLKSGLRSFAAGVYHLVKFW